jgi:undecaprenyl-diphosphatase
MPTTRPSAASTVLIIGLGASTWWDMSRRGPMGVRHITASIQSASWAVGAAAVTKALVARKRPVLYTPDAVAAAAVLDNQRSWPSGHAAAAAALAASYLLTSHEKTPDWARWAAVVGALTVGGLRVVAHRHFPSDVLAGAAIGVASAIVVHEIRF